MLSNEERQLIAEHRNKKKKKSSKKMSESDKLVKHRIQYTKIAVSTMLVLTSIVVVGSLYINLRTQSNMDAITIELLRTFCAIFMVYGVKSYFETKQEKKLESFKENEDMNGDEY